MKTTIKYTKNLSDYDSNNIPIEQQICLMKASDTIKEKAMIKFKEVKAKSEDSGSKARQYLDGLLKIPFGIFKKEEILILMKDINENFLKLINTLKKIPEFEFESTFKIKQHYTILEIKSFTNYINDNYVQFIGEKGVSHLIDHISKGKRYDIIKKINYINSLLKKNKIKKEYISRSGKKKMF